MITARDIGSRVKDAAGRIGILRDVIPDYEDPSEPPQERRKRSVAFLAPVHGGREWLVPPRVVERVDTCEPVSGALTEVAVQGGP